MTIARRTGLALAITLVAALTGTAEAADPADPWQARDEARREQAALAADLDLLEASEAELVAAAEVLAAEVDAQVADVAASRQAVATAASVVARAERAVVAARTELDLLTTQLVDRAVNNFIVPERTSLYDVAVSADFTEAARKQAFIQQVVADEAALVDRLDAARDDLEVRQEAARAAEAQALLRRAENERRLAGLEAAADEHARVQAAVEERQADVLAEIEALSAHEAELTALIEQREREQREREERERREREQREREERERAAAEAAAAAERARAAERQRAADQAAQEARDNAAREQAARAREEQEREERDRVALAQASSRRSAPVGPSPARVRAGGCTWPTAGTVTSEFGTRWGRLHAGVDIAASVGTPIYAAKSGRVLIAGTQGAYGTTVVLDHGDMTTIYAHQSRLAVRAGASVGQGQLIGYVGNTGRSTGPHLHFETWYGGSPKDPRSCLP